MRSALWLAASLVASWPSSLCAQSAPAAPARIETPGRLVGDAEAVIRVEKMLARLGGADAWRRARTLYLKYEMAISSEPAPRTGFTVQYINFDGPGDRILIDVKTSDGTRSVLERGYNTASGWRRRDGQLTVMDQEMLAARVSNWSRDFYSMFHRFAVPDPALRLSFAAPNTVNVSEASGAPIGEWTINKDGDLILWRSPATGGVILTYLIGPPKRFGSISFGAWNGSTDGLSRYTVEEFGLSASPMPEAIYIDPTSEPKKPPMM